jgi:hypothetical protein
MESHLSVRESTEKKDLAKLIDFFHRANLSQPYRISVRVFPNQRAKQLKWISV